ncbi:hypothetical protein EUTSA_v10012942mg [Eutrema salsugineum]|uniref:RRM domain-containing protein n=1 Tax=Eutrema salsugineum TaxID=72664 RepID=V4KX69_EUTSA|nr:putative uncharacterized protein DDB_G0282133 [Eutrema salsugineum]ESQ42580.1 hypothetical protein EUTSA_v10012942mg [Eutrema salsugineum]
MEGGGSGGGVRLHVGGLGESVGKDDLLKIFSPMGSVDSVEFVRTKGRSFAYIDFSPSSDKSLTKLFSTYNGCIWKGGKLRLEKAKEHYLARLRRGWEESASTPDDTIKAPEKFTPSTQINIFIPRLRKVKSLPLSGTGKHKYSFQRVSVPSSLPKTFCDCEEHSASLTPRETHVRDLEALNVGINEEEVNIMNSVMSKLFENNDNDNNDNNDNLILNDNNDNLIINVVSNGNDMMDSELDILSRKRKSTLNEASGAGYIEGRKGNNVHPKKKRQSIILEKNGRQESSQTISEKKKPSEVDPNKSTDEPSRKIGVKRSTDNISWSQKSSWKALVANGNSNHFTVSSFLPGVGSNKAVQSASGNTDLAGLPSQENSEEFDVPNSTERPTVTKIKKTKRKRITSTIIAENVAAEDDIEKNDIVTDISVEAEPLEASTENDCENDNLNVETDENVAEDLNAEKESLDLKDNVDHDVDKDEAGKASLEARSKSTGGSSWLQRASWTQLVSDRSASFSITQLFPDLASDKNEAARVNNNGDGQFSNFNQSESGMKQRDNSCSTASFEAAGVQVDSTPVRSLEENRQSLKGKNVREGCKLAAKMPIRRKIGSGETCTFMRSATSLKEWAKAKKALSEPRRKKKSEE